jgi:hypothetical protein
MYDPRLPGPRRTLRTVLLAFWACLTWLAVAVWLAATAVLLALWIRAALS